MAFYLAINHTYKVARLFSHEEIGLLSTFDRDKSVKKWCKAHNIVWYESASCAVSRGKKKRFDWRKKWQACWENVLYCSERCRRHKCSIKNKVNE